MNKLLLALFFYLPLITSPQEISFNLQNPSISVIISEIESQTDLKFAYGNDIDTSAELKGFFKFEEKKLKEVIKVLSQRSPYTLGIVGNNITITKDSVEKKKINEPNAQKSVRGTVTDSEGMPIPGVNVLEKGTPNGTVTNFNGEYTINVSTGAVLVFSYLGFETIEVPVEGQTNITISMKSETSALKEVVVVGYGTQQKENLTGAIGQIEAEDIALRPSANIAGALQGMLPGLNIQVNSGDPTATPDINIRGFNSLNGGSPLVLVDGIVGDITRVNPLNIKSVTVLKDAASAAIYGARGAFGVILITTKNGKAGEIEVNYTNYLAWTTPTTRTDFVSDPYVYGKTVDAAIFGYNGSSYTDYDAMDWETIKMVADGEIEPFHELQPNGEYKFFYDTDWHDYLLKDWQSSKMHNLSISGGSEKLRGYLSGRIYEREKINNIQDANMERYNLKASMTYKPTDWLELSNNIVFTHEKDEDFGGYRNGYGGIWSTTTWYQLMPFMPTMVDGVPADVLGQGGPAAMEDGHNWRKFNTEIFTNTFRAKLTPLDGLEINFNYSNRINNKSTTYRYNEFEYLAGRTLSLQTGGVNRLSEYRWKDYYKALNIFGTYSFDLADKHNFKIMVGYNQENFDRDRVLAQQGGLLIRDLANLALGTEIMAADGSAVVWALQGYFGRFNYNYDHKYLLEINARYDGSSRFPEDSRWGVFPSVSAGWQIDREDFWEPMDDIISNFKLRASYGKLGNQDIGVSTFLQLMSVGRSNWLVNGEPINYAGAPGPLPEVVTWENTSTIDFGVDFGFFDNKLRASFDWYEKNVEGMYLPGEPLPAVFGAPEPRENTAALRNRGFELSLTYTNSFEVGGSPLSISATGSVSDFNGVITKFDNPNGVMSTYWEGQELGQIWGYHVDGQFQSDEEALAYQESFVNPSNSLGNVYNYILNVVQNNEWNRLRGGDIKYVDTDGDGRIDTGDYTLEDHGDLQPIGNAMPQFPFGFNISANWKGIDLSIAGAGVANQDWYPTGDLFWGTYERPYLSFIRKDLIANAWTPETPENTYPQIYRGYAALGNTRSMGTVNDFYLTNVGYLRIKNLTLGYTLPRAVTGKFDVKRLRVYFSGENIFTWRFGGLTEYIDPEQAGSEINYSNPGSSFDFADLRSYPMGKTFSMGINITL